MKCNSDSYWSCFVCQAQFYFNPFCIMDIQFMSTAPSLCSLQSHMIKIQKRAGHVKEKFSSKRDWSLCLHCFSLCVHVCQKLWGREPRLCSKRFKLFTDLTHTKASMAHQGNRTLIHNSLGRYTIMVSYVPNIKHTHSQ